MNGEIVYIRVGNEEKNIDNNTVYIKCFHILAKVDRLYVKIESVY